MVKTFILNLITFLINSPLRLDIKQSASSSFDLLYRFQGNGKGEAMGNVFLYEFIEEGRLRGCPFVVPSVEAHEEVFSLCLLVHGAEGYIHSLYDDDFCSRP